MAWRPKTCPSNNKKPTISSSSNETIADRKRISCMSQPTNTTTQSGNGSPGANPAQELGLAGMLRSEGPPSRILIVEDDRIVALDLAATLKQLGYTVVASASSG